MNAYDSLTNTFTAADIYNKTWPVTPPADLTLALADTANGGQVFFSGSRATYGIMSRFDRRDQPYLKSLGIYCNMGDCLVDNVNVHDEVYGLSAAFGAYFLTPPLTGYVTNTQGTDQLTGTGTLFTEQCVAGQKLFWLDNAGTVRISFIDSIQSDVALTLTVVTPSTGMYTSGTSLSQCFGIIKTLTNLIKDPHIPALNALFPYEGFLADVSPVVPLTGMISVAGNSITVTGKGTKFVKEITNGQPIQWVNDVGVRVTRSVLAVTSDTLLTLNSVTSGTDTTNATLLDYDRWQAFNVGSESAIVILGRFGTIPSYATILVDPAFATKRLSFSAIAEIEHTFPVVGTMAKNIPPI